MHTWKIIINKLSNGEIKKGLNSYVNPYSMLLLENNSNVANGIDFWHIDGISLLNLINKKFSTTHTRQSFDDTAMAPRVFKFAKDNNLKTAIIGTTEEHIKQVIPVFQEKFGITASYYRNGYFYSDEERENCFQQIINQNIEVVIVGMGTPFQEEFLIQLKKKGWSGYGYTCGGYLHQTAKRTTYYPAFFDKLNIRWVFRILDEPKLFTRYFIDYPRFFYRFRKAKEHF